MIIDIWLGSVSNFTRMIKNGESFYFPIFIDALPFAFIITGLSLVTSLIAMWDYKDLKRKSNYK
jgi:hypothetical protein